MIAFSSLQRGVGKLEVDVNRINQDLEANWEVLAEPVQTVMRRYGLENPYEQLKSLTRGKSMGKEAFAELIHSLNIPDAAKKALLELTPHSYTGLAEQLAKQISKS
jgi:adenylosuccinate lyase